MTKKIVKRTDANNETLYFYTHSDAVDVGEGNATISLTNALNSKASASDLQALSNTVNTKASASDLQALSNVVATKASASDLNSLNNVVLKKTEQALTQAEKEQVHNNLDTDDFLDERAVRYDEPQVLGSDEKAQALTNLGLNGVDEHPTKNSTNMVRSGGIAEAIDDVQYAKFDGIQETSVTLNTTTTATGNGTVLFYVPNNAFIYKVGNTYYTLWNNTNRLTNWFYNDGESTPHALTTKIFINTTNGLPYSFDGANFTTVVIDDEPTAGSENLVKSGGVYEKIEQALYDYTYKFNKGAYLDYSDTLVSFWNGGYSDYIEAEVGDNFTIITGSSVLRNELYVIGYNSEKELVRRIKHLTSDNGYSFVVCDDDVKYVRVGTKRFSATDDIVKINKKKNEELYEGKLSKTERFYGTLDAGEGTSGYIKNNGTLVSPYDHFEVFELKLTKGSKLTYYANIHGGMCSLAKKVSDSEYIPLIPAGEEVYYSFTLHEYICTEDCTVVITTQTTISTDQSFYNYSFYVIESPIISTIQDRIDELDTKIDNINEDVDNKINALGLSEDVTDDMTEDIVEGKFINTSGSVLSNSSFAYKEFQVKAGAEIEVTEWAHPSVAVIAKKITENTYEALVTTDVGFRIETHSYVPTEDMTIAVSFASANPRTFHMELNVVDSIKDNLELLQQESSELNTSLLMQDIDYGFMFEKIAVIGDSLASGRVEGIQGAPDAVGADFLSFSWLTFLAKRWRCAKSRNYSNAGATTATWISQWLPIMQADEEVYDVYFIALGTNNEYNESNPSGDSERYNAFVQRYNDIIDAVRTKAPHAAIFLVSLYEKRGGNTALENIAAERMATDDGIYYIDYANEAKYFRYSEETNWRGHFSSTGYTYAASAINQIVNRVIWQNKTREFWQQFAKHHNYITRTDVI